MKKTLFIMKSRSIGENEGPETTIDFSKTSPDFTDLEGKEMLIESDRLFTKDANALEDLLYKTLPSGTYDRLLIKMSERDKSHFVIPLAEKHRTNPI